jgi:hypothetical protein
LLIGCRTPSSLRSRMPATGRGSTVPT